MKKLFIAVFLIGICFSIGVYFWQSRPSQQIMAQELTPEQLTQKIDQDGAFYVYFYSPTCKDCITSEPFLAEALQKVQVDIVKVNVKKYPSLRQILNIPGTPAIFYYDKGKLVKGSVGSVQSAEAYIQFFKKY